MLSNLQAGSLYKILSIRFVPEKITNQQQFLFYYFIRGRTLTRWWEVVCSFQIFKKKKILWNVFRDRKRSIH